MRSYMMVLFLFIFGGCTKYDEINTGIHDGKHDCMMLEYFQNGRGSWDSLVIAIRHAGIEDIFSGKATGYEHGITFFGMTNYSIKHFLKHTLDENGERIYMQVTDIPRDLCRTMILSHVIEGKMMMQDFDYEVKGTLDGGTVKKTLTGKDLRIYRITSPEGNIPDAGPEYLGIHALESGVIALIESCNIETTNGVVHSLRSEYEWTEL